MPSLSQIASFFGACRQNIGNAHSVHVNVNANKKAGLALATGALLSAALRLWGARDMKMTTIEKYFVNSPDHTARVADRAAALLQRIPIRPGQSYLDVGCGVGAAPRKLAQSYPGLSVTGVDVDPGQIEAAERGASLSNLRFQAADATRLPFADGQFDIVATNKVMHHIPGWERAFAEMVRVLRPGGFLVFGDLALPEWLGRIGGVPTDGALNRLAAQLRLEVVYQGRSWAEVEAIWQKPEPAPGILVP